MFDDVTGAANVPRAALSACPRSGATWVTSMAVCWPMKTQLSGHGIAVPPEINHEHPEIDRSCLRVHPMCRHPDGVLYHASCCNGQPIA